MTDSNEGELSWKESTFKLHKVKALGNCAVTGLTLGLGLQALTTLQLKNSLPINEATVEAIIKKAPLIEAPATNEATAKPTENTPTTLRAEAATVSEH